MSITVDFSPADVQLIRSRASEEKMELSEFIRQTMLKYVRNAAYLAEIDRRTEDIRRGKNIISFTDEEWDRMINEKEFS